MLGPLLFVININDLDANKFANDPKMNSEVRLQPSMVATRLFILACQKLSEVHKIVRTREKL